MATVFLAHDTVLDREVALKIPHAICLRDRVQRERFYRGGRAAARIRHPNICPLIDLGDIEDTLYLTMPFIEGQLLSERPSRDPLEAVRWCACWPWRWRRPIGLGWSTAT